MDIELQCEVLSVAACACGGSTAAKDQVIDGFSFYRTPTGGVVPPFRKLDHAQVGRLMGPKPVAWQGPVGFSPDDWNFELFHLAVTTHTSHVAVISTHYSHNN